MSDRLWSTEMQRWIYDDDVYQALDMAQLAIMEYHNGDRKWAEAWLIRAYEANQKETAK